MSAGDFKTTTTLPGKILAQGQVAAANTDTEVYVIPNNESALVTSAALTNTSVSTAVVTVYVVPSGDSVDITRAVVYAYSLGGYDSTTLVEVIGATLDGGVTIWVRSTVAGAVNYLITGLLSS